MNLRKPPQLIFRISLNNNWGEKQSEYHLERGKSNSHIKLKSLIMAQIERWRNALHMQVERQHGLRSGGEWRTGE